VAGFLSATIMRLQETWADWSEQWFGAISPRAPMPRPLPWKGSTTIVAQQAEIDRRRAIALPADREHTGGGRFGIKTSQTLAQACAALSEHSRAHHGRSSALDAQGRRVFVLAAPRGVGKGHFFSALTEDQGLARFLKV